MMYEVKSRCVETRFDGWEVRVRERQHVTGEITLGGISHYGIRSMRSSTANLFEHLSRITFREMILKNSFSETGDTYEIEKESI